MCFIPTTEHLIRNLQNLPTHKSVVTIDENGKESVIESICQVKIHGDNDHEWCWGLKIREVEGCVKR